MYNFFSKNKRDKNDKLKVFFLKEYFNSTEQKRSIMKAAKESAEDQNILMKKYRQLIKS